MKILKECHFINKLKKYMDRNFLDLELKSPLFYNYPIGLRIELCSKIQVDKSDILQVHNRINTLFSEIFHSQDDVYVILFMDSWNDYPLSVFDSDVRQHIFGEYISPHNNRGPYVVREEVPFRYPDPTETDEDGTVTHCYYTQCKVKDIDTYNLLNANANSTMEVNQHIMGDLYMINATKDIIFHNYDHRGVDIISRRKETIQGIYQLYNHWLLDYDRNKMNSIFREIIR
ncbi:DUF3885 domain-containing protein [Mechercharimyces sp. CAU 1602]|uniref:DUF3885 domain-containing protein n=1 Tax=Mechercharimyces sp. CAU 1602 TaxID=2973933 RepID=UPI00216359B9|nr:DUF3885 domain-containing protein [Mechercharimyces sp. CAU 1602]MCS1350914.1 DUF3885 domain-containing protein [Mechercharimyces sp. CAU 1602]